MKNFSFGVGGLMLVLIFSMVCLFTESLRVPLITMPASMEKLPNLEMKDKCTLRVIDDFIVLQEGVKEVLGMELYPTGSSLPDCSHACGPCFPCKRVIVSFKCSISESCPIVYRCMCKGKYYPVPSN
ncbi:hypothetical protein CRYUN_Cryun30bG0092700 [Craigia yunnanensis]